MTEEFLDVVDDEDRVVGRAARDEIYAQLLQHRIVHVLIFDRAGRMLLQKRSRTKSYAPLHWSTAVGGHVQSGESYDMAAQREFEEELGTLAPIKHLRTEKYVDPISGLSKYLATFSAQFEGPFTPCPEEVESVDFFTLDQVRSMLSSGELFHPELQYIVENYY